jgi:hypothetical protein
MSSATPPFQHLYGMSGYGGIPFAPLTTSTIVHVSAPNRPLPIHSIPLPHSPSPLPFQTSSPLSHAKHHDHDEGNAVPRYYKLSIPMFDSKDDPLDWLNRSEQFFRAQRTREADNVWLASFHITGAAQYWYYMLESDIDDVSWSCSRRYATNTLDQLWASTTSPILHVCNSVALSLSIRKRS